MSSSQRLDRKMFAATDNAWANPSSSQTINHAWWTVQRNSITSPCRDVVDYFDYQSKGTFIRSGVRAQLKSPANAPLRAEYWKAPRSNGCCRIVALPDLVTRVSLQALGLSMSDRLNAGLTQSVFSRPGPLRSTEFVDGWYGQWSQYFAQMLRLTKKFKYLVVSDFARFFDSIDLAHVEETLDLAGVSRPYSRAVCVLLRRSSYVDETERSLHLGIPQLYDDTALLLANYYLNGFDQEVIDQWTPDQYARWLDDIILGANTESDARTIVARLKKIARRFGLSLNTHKTKILRSIDVEQNYLFLKEHKQLDAFEIEAVLDHGATSHVRLRHAFRRAADQARTRIGSGLGEILLRRIYRIGSLLDSPHLLPYAAADLANYPNSASSTIQYLSSISQDESIPSIISNYLKSVTKVYQTIEIGVLLRMVHRHWSSRGKKNIAGLATEILQGCYGRTSDSTRSIAAFLLTRYARRTETSQLLSVLSADLMATQSPHALRYAYVALCCTLPQSRVKRELHPEQSKHYSDLAFLFVLLKSCDFDIENLSYSLAKAE
jgi:hypothetical protein